MPLLRIWKVANLAKYNLRSPWVSQTEHFENLCSVDWIALHTANKTKTSLKSRKLLSKKNYIQSKSTGFMSSLSPKFSILQIVRYVEQCKEVNRTVMCVFFRKNQKLAIKSKGTATT